jgi:hypothetical protein
MTLKLSYFDFMIIVKVRLHNSIKGEIRETGE